MPPDSQSPDRPQTVSEAADHQHAWENGPVLERSRESRSPCSTWDDHLWTEIIQVQTCACGEIRRLLLGFKDRRRRGDDYRRAAGKAPLGVPLRRSGTYRKPIVLGSAKGQQRREDGER